MGSTRKVKEGGTDLRNTQKIKWTELDTGKQSLSVLNLAKYDLTRNDKKQLRLLPGLCSVKDLLRRLRIEFQGFPAFKYHHLAFRCEMLTTRWLGRLCAFQEGRTQYGTFGHLGETMSQMYGRHLLPQQSQAQGSEQQKCSTCAK